jgi:hypothetical protein
MEKQHLQWMQMKILLDGTEVTCMHQVKLKMLLNVRISITDLGLWFPQDVGRHSFCNRAILLSLGYFQAANKLNLPGTVHRLIDTYSFLIVSFCSESNVLHSYTLCVGLHHYIG